MNDQTTYRLNNVSRRNLLKGSVALGAAGALSSVQTFGANAEQGPGKLKKGEVILFQDTLKLKPTILSIMVGINDLWHMIAFGSKYKGTVKDYEDGYRRLIEQSRTALPGVRIVIYEPFELRKWEKSFFLIFIGL